MNIRICFALPIVSILIVACAPPLTPTASTTPPAVGPSASPGATTTTAPRRGGEVTIAIWQSPATLNDLLSPQPLGTVVRAFFREGMTQVLGDGTRVPQLAKEVPTIQNGGVSADGKTIIYHLKDGLLWSDGQPVTCDDFVFLWQARTTPGVGVTSSTGYSDIDTVECPTPTTVVVKFRNFFAPYLTLFNETLPKHYAGDLKDMRNWQYNRKPIGTGPFNPFSARTPVRFFNYGLRPRARIS
jgi:peptide/nickel transport system substrate-binding protein